MSEQLCSLLVVGIFVVGIACRSNFSPLPFTRHCVLCDNDWKILRAASLSVLPTEEQASMMPPSPSSASCFVLFAKIYAKRNRREKKDVKQRKEL